jgi:hypothetical protein
MITRQTILGLIEKSQDPSVSIYIPTHIRGEEVQQDPIRFKNALTEAEEQLRDQHIAEQTIDALLEEPRKWLDEPLFWQQGDRGLAVFLTEDTFDHYRVPLDFKTQVYVEDHFLITPLLPMVTLEGTYCVLALSQKNVRLLKATRESVSPIELHEAPTSMQEYLKYNVEQPGLQHHAGQGTGRGKAKTHYHSAGDIFHGHGADGDTDDQEVINYLKHIENEVTSILRKRNDPLILVGMEKAVAEYRKVNHYDRVMDDAISRNPDDLSNEEINDLGWTIIESYFLQDMYNAMDRFADLTGSDKQSDDISEIVEASYYGRVDSLFVPVGEQRWGWFDMERDKVHHSSEPRNGEHDLINMAAIKTLTQGGTVYALQRDQMPQEKQLAAIFRYG